MCVRRRAFSTQALWHMTRHSVHCTPVNTARLQCEQSAGWTDLRNLCNTTALAEAAGSTTSATSPASLVELKYAGTPIRPGAPRPPPARASLSW